MPFVMISPNTSGTNLVANRKRSVTATFNPLKVVGKHYYDGLGYTGTDTANPTHHVYAHIVVASNVQGTDTALVRFMLSIDFVASFMTPIAPLEGS